MKGTAVQRGCCSMRVLFFFPTWSFPLALSFFRGGGGEVNLRENLRHPPLPSIPTLWTALPLLFAALGSVFG